MVITAGSEFSEMQKKTKSSTGVSFRTLVAVKHLFGKKEKGTSEN